MVFLDRKYELIDVNITDGSGSKVYRVKALKDFGNVKHGEFGGLVSSESNLSHKGLCWLSFSAQALGCSTVTGNAQIKQYGLVTEDAIVSGNALVKGYAKICGGSIVTDNAKIIDDSEVSGFSIVKGKASIEGCSKVSGDSIIKGFTTVKNSSVFGDAFIDGDVTIRYSYVGDKAHILSVKDVLKVEYFGANSIDTLTLYKTKDDLYAYNKDYLGSFKDYLPLVLERYKDTDYEQELKQILENIIDYFGEYSLWEDFK